MNDLERLTVIETKITNIECDIREIKERLNSFNGMRKDVTEIQVLQKTFVTREEFVRFIERINRLAEKIEEYDELQERQWRKMIATLTIIVTVVSGIINIVGGLL